MNKENMNKKGFTLIELLAVIVILAVIAIITVPTIIGVIDRARKASYKDSVYGIIESARIYLASNQDITKEIEFVCNEEECKRTNGDKLEFKGTVPKSGSIYIKEDGSILVESLYNGRYYANNETGEVVITDSDSTMTRGELTEYVKNLQNEINTLKTTVNKIQSHVGMIVQSATLDTEEKVKAIYGGESWSKIEGKFLLGQSSSYAINSTGGEETHTLTANELPPHRHAIPNGYGSSAATGSLNLTQSLPKLYDGNGYVLTNTYVETWAVPTEVRTLGQAHNNMPPYKAVYIWERTK